uniref:Mitochondrial fission 1 protein n=1 Tax=Chromera velia CCMP2878 TaxID=1169474 RepID=A0A0G4GYX0_9ALVE|mmetsp:Transcript_29712/g.58304  ORF Transcript_29712/g.58304 Transcript_29712/m.58304 type:complete len:150 (+) Transcript_29712:248-697(+)|eukprot:Cvel_23973.t1-p1 / transcript=Cvel_23973.t1 / gene=Cvel_23973 / organism=Chromera_velia_CCMP2878 / gene_product=Mitochondria fission 1 protein, putative / transcript_product=Mitochondria fission 1 protein, putative / location=Cvel_scaffold2537:14201-16440(-) / protein_length=149 / sequence_SO=supercontig / SO=protein_coding / is_pseudo=false
MEFDSEVFEREKEELRQLFEESNEEEPSPRLQLDLGAHLCCSIEKEDVKEGIELLQELLSIGYRRQEVLYQLALGHMKLGKHAVARKEAEMLLRMEPRNLQYLAVHSLIVERTATEGSTGSILLLASVASAAFFLFSAWKTRQMGPVAS